MQHTMRSVAAGLALACIAAGGIGAGVQGPGAGGDVVGVIDFVKVFEVYPRALEERRRLDELERTHREKLRLLEEKAFVAKADREKMSPGTRERDEKDVQFELAVREHEASQRMFNIDYGRERDKFIVTIYEDIERALAQVAKARGVKLVVRMHGQATDKDDADVNIKSRLYDKRVVWYAHPDLDLTDDVIKVLRSPVPPAGGDK